MVQALRQLSLEQDVRRSSLDKVGLAHPAAEADGDGCHARGGSLVGTVRDDVAGFIAQQNDLMFNELDFQMQLALYLRAGGHYDDVDVEYFLPRKLADGYDWDSNLYIDIVVSRDGEYVPVELKYTTSEVRRDLSRFGTTVRNVPIIRSQGADNNIRYNFWKDIRRIEIIKKLFDRVHSGLAVMLTCDRTFLNRHRPSVSSYEFSMNEGFSNGNKTMDFRGDVKSRQNHRPFRLDGVYTINWNPAMIDGVQFNYTIVEI